ncbi:SCP160 protein [Artomyces pyxidatus]|uniref:SCP160 protein n=1 Tax=Artomyces pyxidatus TaxID=48021 RepID=A0ACB8TD42_9AGAM|nr:SCP160 protein [Artomyces pyxidatus]
MDAAGLQRLHQLEGAPDPFPSLNDPTPAVRASAQPRVVDTESHDAFPSLAPAGGSANRPAASAWSAAGPRIKPASVHPSQATESFTLSAIDLSTAGKDGKPITLGEIMKQVMAKFKVRIEASTNQKTRQTTFFLKADSKKDLEKSKRSLVALLSPVVSIVIDAPASTIATIIGPKGATLKQIRDQTTVKIDIPRRDSLAPSNGNGVANGSSNPTSGVATPVPTDEDDEPTIPITVTGPQPLAYEAQEFIKQIIATKTSKTTQRVRDIPAHIVPFVKARHATFKAAAQDEEITLTLNSSEREVTVSGNREAVVRVIEAIKGTVAAFTTTLTSVKITLPKRQHRLLVGKAADEIMSSSKCSVSVPLPEEPSEEITVWGKAEDLGNGLTAVMTKANSQYIHEFPLPGPIALSRQILTYIVRSGYIKTITAANPGVSVFTPSPAAKEKATALNVDIVGDKPVVDETVRQFSQLMGKLIGATKDVPVDWLVHKIITTKNAKKIKAFHDAHNVLVFFPPESDEQSSVLLVYDPASPTASPSPVEKAKNIEEVEKELLKLAHDAADVKSQTVAVEKKWHEAVVGKGGTTLNAVIGEEKTLSIKFGAEAGDPSTEDVILVRGASSEVDRAVKEILDIVENAKNDHILSGHSVEFEIDRDYVGRIVGSQGSGVNKLRDQLGVNIDFSDEADDGVKDVGKKKKPVHQKTKVIIVGRKENVEEAKRRILSQVERLADETSEVLKIPTQYHSGLIGQSGKYVIRLEEKYSVKITFPRESAENGESKTREHLKNDEVLVKGGRKGVANAKSELMEAVEFEKESNNVVKFTVPARAIPRILGKGGVTINEIKDETGAQIDLDKTAEDSGSAQITCRGTKKAISAAKAAIQAIADQVGEEVTVTLTVESRFHKTLIGAGGQGLKALIARCGGPSDSKAQAGLVRFPRQGEEPNDEVRLRGDPAVVARLKIEIEKVVGELRDRVVLGVDVPASHHSALIGRGGRNLTEFQTKYGVQVQYPGSNSYNSAGAPENAAELADVAPATLVKVTGPRAAVEKAIEFLKVKTATPESVTDKVVVPLKYHHAVTQQNTIFRTLRSFGVQADLSAQPQKSAVPTRPESTTTPTARIDDVDDAPVEIQWQVVPNYVDAEEGDSEWTLKARDQAALDKAKTTIQQAVERAEAMSHVGFLTLPDRSSFPRIVGAKGSNIARLHAETGADVTVSRENSTIVLMGKQLFILAMFLR